jgi:hypothetical protein
VNFTDPYGLDSHLQGLIHTDTIQSAVINLYDSYNGAIKQHIVCFIEILDRTNEIVESQETPKNELKTQRDDCDRLALGRSKTTLPIRA